MEHDWTPSTLGHGETMCRRCLITNREAAVLGWDECRASDRQLQAEDVVDERRTEG